MATRAEVAKRAGVSPATVSNLYNGMAKISENTQERILRAANELSYPVPSFGEAKPAASVNAVFIAEDIANPHYSEILQGMNHVAEGTGATISMMLLWQDIDAFCKMLIQKKFTDVCIGTNYDKLEAKHKQLLTDAKISVHLAHNVAIDRKTLMVDTVRYLAHLGHTKIAYLSGLDATDNLRLNAFVYAMEECGLALESNLIIDGIYPYDTDAKSGYLAMKNHLDRGTDLTAVIALNDLLAIGAMGAILEKGLRIPEDISVIGNDDIPIAQYVTPSLTTMRISAFDIGMHSMHSILQNAHGKKIQSISLQSQLVLRKSSGKAPVK